MKTRILAVFILLVTFLLAFFVYQNEPKLSGNENVRYPFSLGLDLAGGAQLTYRADISDIEASEVPGAMETLKTVIERRINPLGQQETNVQIQEANLVNGGEYRVIVELPGVTDISEAKKQIGETPILEFKLLRNDIALETLDPETTSFDDIYVATKLTGRYLESSSLQFVPGGSGAYGSSNQPVVALQFNDEGEALFSQITRENIGRELAIFLDGVPISNPIIREEITGGEAIISGDFTPEEAKSLAEQLNFGALPVPIEEIGTQTIGASLGGSAIDAGIKAGVIGLLALSLFFLLWYRLPGLVTVFTLFVYGALMFAFMKVIPITITAAGIAGFIISLGVAVDANVLISERLKEEMKKGKNLKEAVTEGFSRAWLSIRDSNLSGMITAVILFWFGSNLIKGFAITFGFGIVVSMVSAIFVTRVFLLALVGSGDGKREHDFYSVMDFLDNFMFVIQYKKIFLITSFLLVLASSVFIFVEGLKPSIEFAGGSLTEVVYPEGRGDITLLETSVREAGFSGAIVVPLGENMVSVKTKDLIEEERQILLETLRTYGELEEVSFTSIGPSIGQELQTKATISLIVVSIAIILFIAYTFRHVSKPVSSWKYGFVAILTLVHDVVLTTGVFALLGVLYGAEVDMLFVVALLTILSLSVNDTIVIFDRIRENLTLNKEEPVPFARIVGASLKQTYARSFNTSFSVIIVLLALALFGPESTKMFAVTLTFGMFFGTYSSLFLASPLLVQIYEWQKHK